MKNAFKIYRRDMKKIFTNTMAIVWRWALRCCPRFTPGLTFMLTGIPTAQRAI